MTLEYAWLGTALLAVSWLTAALVALDALIDVRRLLRVRGWSLTRANVGARSLGWHEVEQRVRRFEVPKPAFGLFDRAHRWALEGGEVAVDGQTLTVVAAPEAQVWPDAKAQAAQPVDPALWPAAGTTKGTLRVVRSELAPGTTVWLAGERDGQTLRAHVASLVDPKAWAAHMLLGIAGLLLLNFVWVALGTAIVFWVPGFESWVSKAGGAVLIGHFLGITPLAIAMRDACRPPSVGWVRGEQPAPAAAAPATA